MEEKKKSHKIVWFIVCFVLVALIMTIVLPAFMPPKDGVGYTKVMCMSNMRQLALACILYHDEQNSWPDKEQWDDLVKAYVDDDAFQCFIDKTGPCSYAMNENIPADANELPEDLVVLFESAPGWNRIGGVEDVVTDRHDQPGANIAFANGHVEFVPAKDIPKLRWTVEQKRGTAVTR